MADRQDGAADNTIARNSVLAFWAYAATTTFTAVLTLYLVRALAPHGYGLFSLALSIDAVLTVPADFGISRAVARFVAERRRRTADVVEVTAAAFRLKLLSSIAISAILFALAGPIANAYGESDLVWPLRGMAFALLGQSVMLLFSSVFVALGRLTQNLRLTFSESVVETGSSIALVALGGGATGAAFGRAIGYGVGALLGAVMLARLLGKSAFVGQRSSRPWIRRISAYAGVLLVVDGAYTLFDQIDALLLGAYLNVSAVAIFRAPMRLVALVQGPSIAFTNSVAPTIARGHGSRPNVSAFTKAIRYSMVLQAVFLAPLTVWAKPVTSLALGPGYGESAHVLLALAPYVFLSGPALIVSVGVNYLGEARRRIPIAVTAIAVNTVLDVILIPRIGVIAGAIGTSIAFTIYVAGHVWVCRQAIALPLGPLALTCLRTLVAAGMAALVLAAFGTEHLSPFDWVAGTVCGTLAYVLVLVVTREVGRAEWGRVRSFLRRVPGLRAR